MLSPGHILLIVLLLVVVLIIWGPKRLPGLGSGVGGAIREFRKAMHHDDSPDSTPTDKTPPKDPPAAG